jgi:hypothetical protein
VQIAKRHIENTETFSMAGEGDEIWLDEKTLFSQKMGNLMINFASYPDLRYPGAKPLIPDNADQALAGAGGEVNRPDVTAISKPFVEQGGDANALPAGELESQNDRVAIVGMVVDAIQDAAEVAIRDGVEGVATVVQDGVSQVISDLDRAASED